MSKRPGTAGDRDVLVVKHRTPALGVPEFQCEDVTGQYHGEDLLRAREERAAANPAARIALIETEQKEQAKRLSRIEIATVEIRGDQKATNASLAGIEKTLVRMEQREDREHAAKTDVDTATKVDAIAAKRAKREALLKVALYLLTGGLVGKILHSLGVL